MLKNHNINDLDNFICGWYIDEKLCDDMVGYHKNADHRWQAELRSQGVPSGANKAIKNSIDCNILDKNLYKRYITELQKCVDLYCKKYTWVNNISKWRVIEAANLQHYIPPDGGYHAWHCERCGGSNENNRRVMVFLTYLNNVIDGGETEFFYQKIKIKAEKGLTIIFPADWMFVHRGIVSNTQEKYIYTGWFSFVKENNL
ncbi:2OG-Fe(II) oxygenase [bacterium]|nr:2OG-Fe(II) oxygenase [bacterium]